MALLLLQGGRVRGAGGYAAPDAVYLTNPPPLWFVAVSIAVVLVLSVWLLRQR